MNMKKVKATEYIMNDCTMKPAARLGLKTDAMSVFSAEQGRGIGLYYPISGMFEPNKDWRMTFSTPLIEATGLSGEA
jgi:hypothetical protein